MEPPLDHFCRYDELTAYLHRVAGDHPDLVGLTSIGQSHEGREIWLVTVTDRATGDHADKPAMWVDANIHATELTASVAAINLVHRLVSEHGRDDTVTAALRTRTFYVVPRVNPDGAELALADDPRHLRSGVRPWPWTDRWTQPGLHKQDVTGDGRILSMRIADPTGAWTTHADDERLMVPVPSTGLCDRPRYRMLDEGLITDFDGYTVPTPRAVQGLDLNRNYAAGWGTNIPGSGDFPGSEPETLALMRAITARPNICGFNAYHTYSGVLLRPSSTQADSALPPGDVWMFEQLGKRCTELSGFPVHSTFEDFTWDRSDTMSGASDDWAYEHLGIYSWTTEFWDPVFAATGKRAPTSLWWVTLDPEIELEVLRWFDQHHPGAYVDWAPFDHPQLGPIEVGGWDSLHSWSNPPDALLADEVAPHADFAIFQALASPCLAIEHLSVDRLGDDVWRINAGVANTGYLPTTVTEWAAKKSIVRPVVADIELPDGAATIEGTSHRQPLGQLAGFAQARFTGGNDGTPNRALVSWVVRAAAGTKVDIVASHQRAGTTRCTVTLEAT
ncbi:MAG: M14 family metallopeptidase [Acidimicrobiales bacterium]